MMVVVRWVKDQVEGTREMERVVGSVGMANENKHFCKQSDVNDDAIAYVCYELNYAFNSMGWSWKSR